PNGRGGRDLGLPWTSTNILLANPKRLGSSWEVTHAGGGLAAATAMAARDAGLPMPEKMILICPWLDACPDDPDQPGIELRDPLSPSVAFVRLGKCMPALPVQSIPV
ncbi:MAG: alpha/beta hydrolase fold domain-containing protein, partial [Sphingomonadales bacterium]|nr:alpha/beta hydrolase fold domain-containing protein [Sphingomonadales bacterium]